MGGERETERKGGEVFPRNKLVVTFRDLKTISTGVSKPIHRCIFLILEISWILGLLLIVIIRVIFDL